MGILVQSISNCLEDTYGIDEGRVIKRICRAKEKIVKERLLKVYKQENRSLKSLIFHSQKMEVKRSLMRNLEGR